MINKTVKTPSLFSRFKTGFKLIIFVETAAFLGSYAVWYRMNRNQEFRGYIHENFPILLESFYKFGEIFDKESLERLRQVDSAVFAVKKQN